MNNSKEGFYSIHHGLIAGASANISGQTASNFFLRGIRNFIQQSTGRHDHTWRAETALYSTVIHKCLLNSCQLGVLFNAFHSHDFTSIRLNGRINTGIDAFSVHKDRTCTAIPFTAALFCSGKAKFFSQHME